MACHDSCTSENIVLRDEWIAYLLSENVRRPLLVEPFGLMVGLEQEWRQQGASDEEISLAAFGLHQPLRHAVHVNTGIYPYVPEQLLEETPEYAIRMDCYGRRVKLFKSKASIPLPLDYPVHDMDSWLKMKPRFEFCPERMSDDWLEAAKAAQNSGALICLGVPGGFDGPRQLLGEEELCIAYYDDPELVLDILQTIGSTAERVLDCVSSQIRVDCLTIHEDLAGKSGPLVGPDLIGQFIKPYYRRLWDMLSSRGTRLFLQDSDGNVNPVISAFMDAGVNCMFPMEPAAGMDIVQVRQAYGSRLGLYGGIDKHVLRKDEAAIRRELEYKMQPSMREGGVVFGLDHRITDGTPLCNYRYYIKAAREILGLEQAWV